MSDPSKERLQKFLAQAGIGSRRKAETFIENGRIKVNGSVAKLGQKIDPSKDHVFMDGRRINKSSTSNIVLAVNKPTGFTCTRSDPYAKKTIFELLSKNFQKDASLHCAGRLDRESQGLIIITNDGNLTYSLTHPSNKILKHYTVTLDKSFPFERVRELIQGVVDAGEYLKVEGVLPNPSKPNELEITLNHGKKREIRRLMKQLGFQVQRLERFKIGKLALGEIRPGQTKRLTQEEKKLLLA
tara:strand:+ start:4975 stop:5700 length:726 start_codon:yes stop_codon:yes gene_type:complete